MHRIHFRASTRNCEQQVPPGKRNGYRGETYFSLFHPFVPKIKMGGENHYLLKQLLHSYWLLFNLRPAESPQPFPVFTTVKPNFLPPMFTQLVKKKNLNAGLCTFLGGPREAQEMTKAGHFYSFQRNNKFVRN